MKPVQTDTGLIYFTNFDGDEPGLRGVTMSYDFMARTQAARTIAGVPFRFTSTVRTTEHNMEVGGAPTSSHLNDPGNAGDIEGGSWRDIFKKVSALILVGFTRIILYKDDRHIHYDSDKTKDQEILVLK